MKKQIFYKKNNYIYLGIDINYRNDFGQNLLMIAARSGQYKLLKYLIEKK